MKMLGLVTRRKMVPFRQERGREGCGGAGEGGPPWKVLRGRRSGSSPGDSRRQGQSSGERAWVTPRWSHHYLGNARWVLGGENLREGGEVRSLCKKGLATRDQGDGEGAVREGREGRIPPAALGARTVPRRLRDAVNFQCLCCYEENTFSDPCCPHRRQKSLWRSWDVARRRGETPSLPPPPLSLNIAPGLASVLSTFP